MADWQVSTPLALLTLAILLSAFFASFWAEFLLNHSRYSALKIFLVSSHELSPTQGQLLPVTPNNATEKGTYHSVRFFSSF